MCTPPDPPPLFRALLRLLSLHSARLVRICSLLALACAALAAVAAIAPRDVVRGRVAAWLAGADADALRARDSGLVIALGAAAACGLVASAGLWRWRRRIAVAVPDAASRLEVEVAEIAVRAVSFARAARPDVPALALFTIAGLALRLRFLSQPLSFDEALTYGTFASRPLLVTLSHYTEPNNHIFHSVLVHVSCALFGDRLWAVRLPALAAGVLMIPASYAAISSLYNRRAGLIAAALIAALSVMIEFSTYARGYSLVALLTVLLIALAASQLRRPLALLWIVFAALSAVGFLTVPIMLYPFGIVLIWMAIEMAGRTPTPVSPRQLVMVTLLTAALTVALYVPAFLVSGAEAVLGNRWVRPVPWRAFISTVPELLRQVVQSWHQDMPAGAAALIAAAFALGLGSHRRASRFHYPVVLAALLWLPLVLVIQHVIPYARTWIFLVPLYAGTAAAGAAAAAGWLARRLPRVGESRAALAAAFALMAWLAAGVIAQRTAFQPSGGTFVDAPGIMELVDRSAATGDTIVVSPASYIMFRAVARLNGIPFARYATRAGEEMHGVVIVNRGWSETPEGVLAEAGVVLRAPPQPIGEAGAASAYRW